MNNNQQQPPGNKKSPLWLWVLIYVAIGLLLIGALYVTLAAGVYDVTSYLPY